MARLDPHSYSDSSQPQTASVDLRARVDFGAKTLTGQVSLTFRTPATGPDWLDLDTRDLTILGVKDLGGAALPFVLHPAEPFLGARLAIELPAGAGGVT